MTLGAQVSGLPGYDLAITDSSLFVYSNINIDTDLMDQAMRVGARVPDVEEDTRFNVYGDPLPSDSKENGRVDVIKNEGVFWGAQAK